MKVDYDGEKREQIWRERHIDLARAGEIFDGFHLTRDDAAHSEFEDRYITVGCLDDVAVLLVWTRRGDEYRAITIWKASERERELLQREQQRSERG